LSCGERKFPRSAEHDRFLSVVCSAAGSRTEESRWHEGARDPARVRSRVMNLYLVPRTRAYLSDEELAAAADCVPAVNETLRGELRWIRSYVVREDDGTYSAYCIYEATGPEVLERHGEALRLPTDAIKPVVLTTVNAPDPA
jgi:hypothetical protein